METPKNTGLGSSLLLRRTERPAVIPADSVAATKPPATVVPEAAPARDSAPEPAPVPPIQVPGTVSKKPFVLRDRCTLYIEREVNDQLHIAARAEGRDRSEIVSEILRKHLPTYRIQRQE